MNEDLMNKVAEDVVNFGRTEMDERPHMEWDNWEDIFNTYMEEFRDEVYDRLGELVKYENEIN